MPLLRKILENEQFETEAKLHAIIAFGDLALAAGPQHFNAYLPDTKQSFMMASHLSMEAGSNQEEKELLEELRERLINSYISILHGLFNIDDPNVAQIPDDRQEAFAMQMFQYLEALVNNQSIAFPVGLLKPMCELYLDLTHMYVSEDSRSVNRQSHVFRTIVTSDLLEKMKGGVGSLPLEDQHELGERFANM